MCKIRVSGADQVRGEVADEVREVIGDKIVQGLGRLMCNEFGDILNEMKSVAVLSRGAVLQGDELGCF